MYLVMVDRWGSYGCDEPYMVFHSQRKAEECVESMNAYDPRDCYTMYEVEVGDE